EVAVRRAPAEALVADPAPASVLAEPAQKSRSAGLIELSSYYAASSISATDKLTGSTANLSSNLDAGIDLRYFQRWNETFNSFVHLNLGTLSFEQPTDASKNVQGSGFMAGIGVGGDSSSLTL